MVLKFDTLYIISAYILYRSISLYSTTEQDRFIKYVKGKLSVTQLQPFAQSATFKLLSLRFNLMITFNHHIKFSKVSSLREHLSGLKTLPAMLNKHSTGADVALLDEKKTQLFSHSTRKCTFV